MMKKIRKTSKKEKKFYHCKSHIVHLTKQNTLSLILFLQQYMTVWGSSGNTHINTSLIYNNMWFYNICPQNPHSTLQVNNISRTYTLLSFISSFSDRVTTAGMLHDTIDHKHRLGKVRYTFMVCLAPLWST